MTTGAGRALRYGWLAVWTVTLMDVSGRAAWAQTEEPSPAATNPPPATPSAAAAGTPPRAAASTTPATPSSTAAPAADSRAPAATAAPTSAGKAAAGGSAAPEGAGIRVEKSTAGKLFRITEGMLVEGQRQKPNAFYVLQRASTPYDWEALDESFLPRIIKATEKPPF